MNITNYEGVPVACMNEKCDNKCTKVYLLKIKSQNLLFHLCDDHGKLFVEEVLHGNDC